MQKWEYKMIALVSESDLNRWGEQGWELVAVASGAIDLRDATKTTAAILKRPKP
jgi:hypothetical protein